VAALLGLTLLAWLYTAGMSASMTNMPMNPFMPGMGGWGAAEFGLAFSMWAVMMAGMMLPTAIPVVLLFAAIQRERRPTPPVFSPVALFVAGYLAAWTVFSLLAAGGQWALQASSLAAGAPAEVPNGGGAWLGGALLIAAGAFQWTPLKHACLRQCRSPLGLFATDWRGGKFGPLLMGLSYGRYCVGCCWLLMTLLFVAGVTFGLLWMAGLTAFILIEKVAPRGEWFSRAAGLGLIAWGAYLVIV
jgi:predicted metal-binding membrane protein